MGKISIKRFIKKLPLLWIATFVFSLTFLVISIPRSVSHASENSSAGKLFLAHQGTDGQVNGLLNNFFEAATETLTGYQDNTAPGVSASGELIYKYKGGLTTALADIGDALYTNPTGSAIIWAQDQYNMALGKGTFTAFAYNTNDTDQYYVSGFTALSSIVGLWNWSRNLVYALFIIILIAVAFMILFRQSLGGQQYVTLTNSMPSLVISLVLITFSYPICALFIDTVSIGCNLVYNVIVSAPNAPGYPLTQKLNGNEIVVPKIVESTVIITPTTGPQSQAALNTSLTPGGVIDSVPIRNTFQPDDPQMSIWSIFYTSNAQVCGRLTLGLIDLTGMKILPNSTGGSNCGFAQYAVPAGLTATFGSLISGIQSLVDPISTPIIEFGLIIMVVSSMFKLLKRIFTDYMTLSFFPIISPWIFLLAALPNRTSKTISQFLRILGGSALNLVVIYACFLLLIVLGFSNGDGVNISQNGTSTKFQLNESFKQAAEIRWLPPMLGYSYGQIIGNEGVTNSTQKIITTLVIITFFLMIPRIPDEISAWLGVPELPPVLRGAGQELASRGAQSGKTLLGAAGGIKNIGLGNRK